MHWILGIASPSSCTFPPSAIISWRSVVLWLLMGCKIHDSHSTHPTICLLNIVRCWFLLNFLFTLAISFFACENPQLELVRKKPRFDQFSSSQVSHRSSCFGLRTSPTSSKNTYSWFFQLFARSFEVLTVFPRFFFPVFRADLCPGADLRPDPGPRNRRLRGASPGAQLRVYIICMCVCIQ